MAEYERMIIIGDNFSNRQKYMMTLAIETTRRCNLNCKWCCKGDAQPVDITTDIIDKAFDEIQDYFIRELKFIGGESFLNANAIEYIVNQIITRNIKIGWLFAFTNATIRDDRIKKAFS